MTTLRDFPTTIRNGAPGWSRLGRSVLAVAAAAAAVSGCSGSAPAPLHVGQSALHVISTAAQRFTVVTSFDATMTVRAPALTGGSMTGTISVQTKPTLALDEKIKITIGSRATELHAIVTPTVLYVHTAQMAAQVGKPWLKVAFTELGGSGAAFAQLFRSLAVSSPVTQAAIVTAASQATNLGTQMVGGVPATHYRGVVSKSASLAGLPAATRKLLSEELKTVKGNPRFDIWIDSRDYIRKTVLTENLGGAKTTTTIDFTSINAPVRITLPPPSQVTGVSSLTGKKG